MQTDIILSKEQEEAVELCADTSIRIACVTGQAGTGKTTILKKSHERLVEELEITKGFSPAGDPQFSIALAAPTGRAAKRIQEATGLRASTIHRMLRFTVPKDDDDFGLPAYSKMNPMPFDVILIDEASMIAEDLRRALIDAMKRGSIIRFFGDINQLPPIGTYDSTGRKNPNFSPFAKDLRTFPSVTLTKNFRSTDGIIELADRVIRNKMPMANDQVSILRIGNVDTQNRVLTIAQDIDFTNDGAQIICPTNKTVHGTENLNKAIQQRFNPEREKITIFKKEKDGTMTVRSFKKNDKVIWTQNDYNLNLMNGSIGRVLDFDKERGTMWINMDDRDIEISAQMEAFNPSTGEKYVYDPRHYLNLGYAISTHKSQGSQFDIVLFVCSRTRAANRQNVYTAVTRAKQKLIILNVAGSLTYALDTLVDIERETYS